MADDDRPRRQLRPIALVHRGEERIEVDMRDGEVMQLGMPDDAARAAAGTPGGRANEDRAAVPA
ncbi:hypothetical protein [Arenibaculum pallidiluteum]|uniref:hypothetical protein n=1 Tax=Arenibaculum pallidiluteum TaxID=2812559 RepID=UPI002E2E7EB5|nr:hypothetical protein [Arenibaculum pallidiluteum]